MCSSGSLLPELLGKPDENSFGAPDVAKPIRIFVLDHFADELRAAFAEPRARGQINANGAHPHRPELVLRPDDRKIPCCMLA